MEGGALSDLKNVEVVSFENTGTLVNNQLRNL